MIIILYFGDYNGTSQQLILRAGNGSRTILMETKREAILEDKGESTKVTLAIFSSFAVLYWSAKRQ
jgi:hypothetical protein